MFIKSFLYLKNYLSKDYYDNIYITSEFCRYDKKRADLGKQSVLPLTNREKRKYIDTMSRWLSQREVLSTAGALQTILLHMIVVACIITADYILFYILHLMKKFGEHVINVRGTARVHFTISGFGVISKYLNAFAQGVQINNTFQVDFNVSTCLPIPHEPDIRPIYYVIALYILTFTFLILHAYGMRMRRGIVAYFYPEQEYDRIMFLHNQIRHKRATIFTWLKQYLPFRRKQQDISEKISLRGMCFYRCPKMASLFGCCTPKEPLECMVCAGADDGLHKFYECKTLKCNGVFCGDCYREAKGECLVCNCSNTLM